MNIIEINNLDFYFGNNQIFSSMNFNSLSGEFILLTGSNSSGKTTFLKVINGCYYNDNVKISGMNLNKNNIDKIHQIVSYIDANNSFFFETVYDELAIYLDCEEYIKMNKIKKILSDFDFLDKLLVSPMGLSYFESQKLALIKAIIKKSKIICLDDIFSLMNYDDKIYLINKLKEYIEKYNITVIYSSCDIEFTDYFDRIIVLYNKGIILDGNPDLVLKHENILKKIGLKMPFIYELNEKLLLYDLVEYNNNTLKELVDELCK